MHFTMNVKMLTKHFLAFKISEFYEECIAYYIPGISRFLMADISFNIACKELKIAQFAQVNQLLQFLNLARIYGIRAAIEF